jgi:cytochrome P450
MDAAKAVELLLSPRSGQDPVSAYPALRAHGPVLPVAAGYYFVSGYAAVDAILRDPTMEAYDAGRLDTQWDHWRDNRAVALFADSMLRTNPPRHTRMRRLAAGVFTARRVTALRDVITAQVDETINGLLPYAGSAVDLVTHLTYPLPIGVITALLGVPPGDRGRFRKLADDLTAVLEVRWSEQDERRAHPARQRHRPAARPSGPRRPAAGRRPARGGVRGGGPADRLAGAAHRALLDPSGDHRRRRHPGRRRTGPAARRGQP